MNTVLHLSAGARPSDAEIDELAHDIARCGITCFEPTVSALADAASHAGACALLVAVLVDTTAPRVARERAFGHVAASLAGTGVQRAPDVLCASSRDRVCAESI